MKENSLKVVSISKTKLVLEGRHFHHITEYQGNMETFLIQMAYSCRSVLDMVTGGDK